MLRTRGKLGGTGLILALFLLPQIVWAGAYTTKGPETLVTGETGFAGACGLSNAIAFGGTPFFDSEVEPWLDVSPVDSDDDGEADMAAAWQQDRWSNGGARGNRTAASFDGGETWTLSGPLHGTTRCTGGPYDRATDPWLTFARDGDLYSFTLSFNNRADDQTNALIVNKSTDGGLTWGPPTEVIHDEDLNVFNDKNSITADPNHANFVYAVWDRLIFPKEKSGGQSWEHAAAFKGPVFFTKTEDGGQTWTKARAILKTERNDQTIGNQIVVLPHGDEHSGRLVNIMNLIHNDNKHGRQGFKVEVILSDDHGDSWSAPIRVSRLGTIEVHDPETGDFVRTGDIIPDIAVNESNGNLYAVWQDARFNGYDEVAFSRSTNGGATWSTPIRVSNSNSAFSNPLNNQAFTPAVEVADDGTVGVGYYDFRKNDPSTDELETDWWVTHCHSGCTNPGNWSGDVRVTPTSFDMRDAPVAGGFFTGDYEGFDSDGNDFLSLVSHPAGNDSADVFVRRVGP
jgi:hypothetical protein